MKRYISNTLLLSAAALLLASCDVNSWNDKLDGFDGDKMPSEVKSIEYTLTDADYTNLAANAANIALAGEDHAAALKAVGTSKHFTDEITAKEYIPNFLSDPDFAYFTLSDGSAIKITYNQAVGLPAEAAAIEGAQTYTLTTADYKDIWGSTTDYIEAFAPSHPADKYLANALFNDFDDADEGDYLIVNYNVATQEPQFGGGPAPEPEPEPTPSWEMTSVIGTVVEGSSYEIQGLVTAIATNGYILTDNSGSIFVYMGNSFDATSVALGDQLIMQATISSYNRGLQVTGSSATVEKAGTQSYTYPDGTTFDGATLDALLNRESPELAYYGTMQGTVKVNGYNINIEVAGAETAMGSVYYAPEELKQYLTEGNQVMVKGYVIAIAGSKYVSMVTTQVIPANTYRLRKAHLKDVIVPTTACASVFRFDGSKWAEVNGVDVLTAADYTAMGQKYPNLTAPDDFLPAYLKQNHPYAQSEQEQLVVYNYYASGTTSVRCDHYTFNGTEWVKDNGVVQETAQFVRTGGKWMYDPNVTVILPGGKNQEISQLYYQACTDWVFENIDKPLGSTDIKSGMGYVTSYGNNEYYCGTSAYQNDVDLRPAKAREQYPAGYEGMTDEEIVALMKKRFETEVMPGALAMLHPDATPLDGIDVIYTITFVVYDGANATHTIRFKVVAQGTFEFIDCTWNLASSE